jgi:hypothetical protein
MSKNSSNSWERILIGLAIIAIFGFLSWLQIKRINEESYWIIFRIWFIPIPAMLLTGIGTLVGIVLFFQGIFSSPTKVSHK